MATQQKPFQPGDVNKVDSWIERLLRCEYLLESEVQELCAKVRFLSVFFSMPIFSVLFHSNYFTSTWSRLEVASSLCGL